MNSKNKVKFTTFLLCTLLSSYVLAKGSPHTWHTVSTGDGTWNGKLQMINEGGSFVTRDSTQITSFIISPNKSLDYGFIFDQGDDFDVAYTLTLTQKSQNSLTRFSSKACVYVITASGPARPDIRVSSFNGAKCDWKVVRGVGEDFFVS